MKDSKLIFRGEAALLLAIIINSIGVLLMLQSGSGISAISSVPYAFSEVFPKLSLGIAAQDCLGDGPLNGGHLHFKQFCHFH